MHIEDVYAMFEAKEGVQLCLPTSLPELVKPAEVAIEEENERSRVQAPVSKILESQLPLITPQWDGLDHDRTEVPVWGVTEEFDAIHHHRDNGNTVHPFHFHWGPKRSGWE